MKITLIGMAGVGKSYIGRKFAEKLNYNFIDVDISLKERTGLNTEKLLEKLGDEKFLELENKVFQEVFVSSKENTVFAPGGSIVYCDSFINNLDSMVVIYLEGNIETIKTRIRKDPRGIVFSTKTSIEELIAERAKLYEKYADFKVDASKGSEEVLKDICDILITEREIC